MDPTVWGIASHQDRSRPAGPVWAHVPHRVGRLLMPLPRRRMGLSSDEHRALSEAAKAGAFLADGDDRTAATNGCSVLAVERARGGLLKPLGVTCAVSFDTIACPWLMSFPLG